VPQSGLLHWACLLVGLSCPADSTPDMSTIQAAYDREQSAGSKLHDNGLQILQAKCDDGATGRFLCQVTFLSRDDPSQRLYFDIVAVARTDGGWELKSGLCKR
jgi:hypothetical protein